MGQYHLMGTMLHVTAAKAILEKQTPSGSNFTCKVMDQCNQLPVSIRHSNCKEARLVCARAHTHTHTHAQAKPPTGDRPGTGAAELA